jgi:uncharacterized membrane protein
MDHETTVTLAAQLGEVFEIIGLAFDVFGVLVIVFGALLAIARAAGVLTHRRTTAHIADPYHRLKIEIGLALLLGLEILVAADIIKTVAVEPSFASLGILGLLVVIRTFLSWTLVLEIEGRWPWQRKAAGAAEV